MTPAPDSRQRRLSRLGLQLFNEVILATLDLRPGDALDAVILVAIAASSCGEGGGVSMNRVADELGVSYETIRRRVVQLRKEGRCEAERGLVRPAPEPGTRDRRFCDRLLQLMQTACEDAAGLELSSRDLAADIAGAPREAVGRRVLAYFISTVQATREAYGVSVIDTVLLSGVLRVNEQRDALGRNRLSRLADLQSFDSRRPASAFQVAKSMGLPYETARRRLIALEAKGLIHRHGPEGVVVRMDVDENPSLAILLVGNAARTERLLADLAVLTCDVVRQPAALP